MNEFTTLAYLLSFPGMIFAVVLLTQFFKKMFDTLFKVKTTEHVAYLFALVMCIVAALLQGDFSTMSAIVTTILVWFVNSVIVWFAAMKAFDKFINQDLDGTLLIDTNNLEKDVYRLELGDNLQELGTKKRVTFKVDTNANLSRE